MHCNSRMDKIARVLLVIAVFLAFAGLTAYYFLAQYQAVVVDKKDKAKLVANHLELQLSGRLAALKMLATDPEVVGGEEEQVRTELSRAVGVMGFCNVVLYDTNACLLVGAKPNLPLQSANDRVSFETALAGREVISGRISRDGLNDAYVSFRVPVTDRSGSVGVLAAAMPISEISRLVNDYSFYNSEYAFVLDGNGKIIFHPQSKVLFSKEHLFAKWQGFFQRPGGVIVAVSDFDEVEKLFVFTEVANTDWRVVVATPIYEVYAIVLKNSLPAIVFFLLLLFSIGSLYYVVAQAKRHRAEMENVRLERLVSTSQLAAGLAHEIRNPLTSIKGFVQLIMRKGNEPPSKSYLDIIYSEIERIEKLVNEFQLLARPVKPSQMVRLDVVKVINDVVMLMQTQAWGKKVTLHFDYQLNSPFPVIYQVMGDEGQLKQVLINLLRNAIEAVSEGGKVTINLFLKENMVAIAVKDNGTGIPQQVLAKLGTPFYTTKQQGTGLGLSVCYSIINNHKGKMEVVSKVGQGTVFTVLLPYSASVDKETEA